jgi:hypothetical protein
MNTESRGRFFAGEEARVLYFTCTEGEEEEDEKGKDCSGRMRVGLCESGLVQVCSRSRPCSVGW